MSNTTVTMENAAARVEGSKIIIEVDASKPGVLSKSGKTKLIASSRGAVKVQTGNGRTVSIALNCFVPDTDTVGSRVRAVA